MSPTEKQHRMRVIVAFALVYVFWGSTYLGIRLAVEHIPPLLMSGMRFLVAGPVMLGFAYLTGRRVGVSGTDFWRLAVIAVLLLTLGNATLAWAEQYVATGVAALIVAIVPLWFLLIDRYIVRGGPKVAGRSLAGIALGLAGILVLMWPKLTAARFAGGTMELLAATTLLGSSFCWALGSVFSSRWRPGVDAFAATGWQMSIAGVVNVLLGLALGEQGRVEWEMSSLLAVGYLIVAGSWIGYTAYIWLLEHVPTSKVSTYAYVNPVVAVFLGWLVLNERITGYIVVGAAIIVSSVALVTSARVKPRREPEAAAAGTPGLPPVQATD